MNSYTSSYELFVVLLALPVSYLVACGVKNLMRKLTAYQQEVDHLFFTYWNGNPDDEYNAWLRVRYQLKKYSATSREVKYIDKKLKEVNKNAYLSGSYVNKFGEIKLGENPPVIRIDKEDHFH